MASSSSNPFRKKSALPEEERFPPLDPIDTSQAYAPPPQTSFPEPQGLDDNDSNDDNDTDNHDSGEHASSKPSTKASKPVKKVRIVSPPPLSPDSPEWPAAQMPDPTYAAYNMPPDPFGGSATDDSDREATPVVATQPVQPIQAQASAPPPPPPPAQRSSGSAPPPNPFSKTLQDIENTRELEIQEREEGEVLKAANATTKPTLDVDAFKRLLMTGKADTGEPTAGDAQDTSLEAKQEKLEVAENTQANKEKKVPPPPPPSSRHGKTLKTESKPVADTPPPTKSQPEAAKPVPEPPFESSETEDSSSEDDSADQAAAAAAASATSPPEQQPPGSAKKPAPAPPPRRGHGRTDTKPSISNASSLAESSTLKPTADDDPPSRSSLDSTPATKSGPPAPAPPPPRRPHAAPKQTGITPSPSISSTSIPQREPLPSSQPDGTIVSPPLDSPAKPGKVPAPPPPPARHAPSRRPPSIQGVDSIPRKTSHEGRPRDGSVGSTSGTVPPPPPPPRMRGASPNNKTQGEAAGAAEAGAAQPPGIGADILADLDALRREVDALRGRVD